MQDIHELTSEEAEGLIAQRRKPVTVSVRASRQHSKVLRIGWSKRDGSLFLHLPYFKHRAGLLARPVLRAGVERLRERLLREGATVLYCRSPR